MKGLTVIIRNVASLIREGRALPGSIRTEREKQAALWAREDAERHYYETVPLPAYRRQIERAVRDDACITLFELEQRLSRTIHYTLTGLTGA